MSEQQHEQTETKVEELVVLSKFDGEANADRSNEVERISILDGVIVSHDVIKDGEVVAPVENDNLVGNDIGRLIPLEGG